MPTPPHTSNRPRGKGSPLMLLHSPATPRQPFLWYSVECIVNGQIPIKPIYTGQTQQYNHINDTAPKFCTLHLPPKVKGKPLTRLLGPYKPATSPPLSPLYPLGNHTQVQSLLRPPTIPSPTTGASPTHLEVTVADVHGVQVGHAHSYVPGHTQHLLLRGITQ